MDRFTSVQFFCFCFGVKDYAGDRSRLIVLYSQRCIVGPVVLSKAIALRVVDLATPNYTPPRMLVDVI